MRGKDFLDKMEFIDPELIEKAEEKPNKKSRQILKFAACFAAAVSICIIPVFLPVEVAEPGDPESPQHETADPGEIAPNISFGGTRFFISPHIVVFNELPEGFEYSGTADAGGYENVPYYTNPDVPEWIYVFHEVRTNGKIDQSGTLVPAEPHNAYVRYVDVRLRGAGLIYYSGEYYISMWSAKPYGDNPDVTAEYYDHIEKTYGIRIAGEAPEGFSFAGTTVFSGYDTVPKENLHSNEGVFDIFANPSETDVIFVSTEWHTADSQKEGKPNKGFNVYIKYDCPFAE